jgi:oxazoline/thiazoline synthase
MTIQTDRDQRKRARAVAGDRGKRVAQHESKDVPCFAPNFTVYVLPPDVVCLYSEARKFFLHGELYCALADAIGAGKSFRQIYREIGRHFPADRIDEAFKRMVDRRYVVLQARAVARHTDAYWASLGLPPQDAEKHLAQCRVRLQSLDVQGARALGAALKEIGVRVVTGAKGKADLTVVLVSDYLERRLDEVNRQHLADRTPWLLVQPSGVFPLVGPVLNPGKGACWVCLAERMARNREIKSFLERKQAYKQATCVANSPLAHDAFGQGGIALAAVEIAKAIATDFRTDLCDHIVSLDLGGSTIARHHVPRRPQCHVCGGKELRDAARAPVPVELGEGRKLIMTSGGYRTVASRATVARFRKHVSPLTGVVSRLERIDADLPLNTNWHATHNFSAPAETVDDLRTGLSGGSFGKGSTAEQGEASALMEAIERYSGIYQGNEIRAPRRFTDFPAGDAILPNDVLLYSDAQVRREQGRREQFLREQYRREQPHVHTADAPIPATFDPSAELEWSPVWSLRDQQFRYLPTSLLYFFYRGPGAYYVHADSNGCAAGNTLAEAMVQGFLELVERDAYAIWWYNRLQRPQVDLAQFDDPYIRDFKAQLADTGRRLWVLDVTSDLGVPSFVAVTHWMDEGKENIEFGSGAHFDTRIALLRALTELNQFLSIGLMGGAKSDKSMLDDTTPLRLEEQPFLTPAEKPVAQANPVVKFSGSDTREYAMACVNIAKQAGLDFLVLDQTRPDIEVPVVRVIVPGLRHFYRRFAPGRLYDVPIKLGLRDRPVPESELNPFHPQT